MTMEMLGGMPWLIQLAVVVDLREESLPLSYFFSPPPFFLLLLLQSPSFTLLSTFSNLFLFFLPPPPSFSLCHSPPTAFLFLLPPPSPPFRLYLHSSASLPPSFFLLLPSFFSSLMLHSSFSDFTSYSTSTTS